MLILAKVSYLQFSMLLSLSLFFCSLAYLIVKFQDESLSDVHWHYLLKAVVNLVSAVVFAKKWSQMRKHSNNTTVKCIKTDLNSQRATGMCWLSEHYVQNNYTDELTVDSLC